MKREIGRYFNGLILAALLLAQPAHAVNTDTADVQNAKQSVQVTEQGSAPATPPTGTQKLYPKTDGLVYHLDDAGTETELQDALPVTDSRAIAKGSSDSTKQIRFEVDGLTTSTTRVITVPDQDIDLGANQTKLDNIETAADVTDATNVDAAGAVMETDYNANTILKSDTDDTPTPLVVSEQTIVGRITSGVITGLTASEVKNLLSLTNVANTKYNLAATGAPTVNDDDTQGYSAGSIWFDTNNDAGYICTNATTGAAVWTSVTSGAAGGDPDQNLFQDFSADTGSDSVADTTTDTLTLTGGIGVLTKSDSTTDVITIHVCDDDEDTCIDTEESADEDKLRFDTGGTQRAVIDANGLTLQNGVSVDEFSSDTTLAGNSDDAVPTEKAVKTYVDAAAINPNLLINGSFQVAQRGTAFDSTTAPANNDNVYLLDGWVLISEGNDAVDVSQESTTVPTGSKYAAHFDAETADKQFGIFQAIDSVTAAGIIGGTASLSFQARTTGTEIGTVRAGVLCWTGTADALTDPVGTWNQDGSNPVWNTNYTIENTPSDLDLTASFQTFTIENISIDTASCVNVGVVIWVDDGTITVADDLYIGQVKLESGARATGWQEPIAAREIETALHFFERIQPTVTSGFICNAAITGAAGTEMQCVLEFVRKRATPSMTSSAAATFKLTMAASIRTGSSGLGFTPSSPARARMYFSFTPSLSGGQAAIVYRDGTDETYIDISAEIAGN